MLSAFVAPVLEGDSGCPLSTRPGRAGWALECRAYEQALLGWLGFVLSRSWCRAPASRSRRRPTTPSPQTSKAERILQGVGSQTPGAGACRCDGAASRCPQAIPGDVQEVMSALSEQRTCTESRLLCGLTVGRFQRTSSQPEDAYLAAS
jgi:hypothetical protein